MNDVEFDDEVSSDYSYKKRSVGIVTRIFIKLGLAKDDQSAKSTMVVFAVVFFIISLFVWF